MTYRPVAVRCCLKHDESGAWILLNQDDALKLPAKDRYYFMDGVSWGNLNKVSTEREGRLNECRKLPCVKGP